MEIRKDLITKLHKHFLSDLSKSIVPLTNVDDQIYFLKTLSGYLVGIYNTVPINEYTEAVFFNQDEYLQEHLLSKFRNKMSVFIQTDLRYYFSKEDEEIRFLFQKLQINEPILEYLEYDDYINHVYLMLTKLTEQLYLKPKEEPNFNAPNLIEESKEENALSPIKSQSKEYTRSRQILLYYFMLKSMGITRLDTSVRKLAQFAHVLFAYPFDNIDNSQLYRKLKQAPQVNKIDKDLLKDLEFVKQQFELIEHEQGIALVEAEIKLTKEAIRKKYM